MSFQKEQDRAKHLALRRSLSEMQRHEASARLSAFLQQGHAQAPVQCTVSTLAIAQEIDVQGFHKHLWSLGVQLGILCLKDAHTLEVRAYRPESTLVRGRWGLHVPQEPVIPLEAIDRVICPMVAWGSQGERLGWGQGHIDRFCEALLQVRPDAALWGVAFAINHWRDPVIQAHDRVMHTIWTEQGVQYGTVLADEVGAGDL